MALGLDVYIYNLDDGTYKNVKDLIFSIAYSCSLDNVAQCLKVTLAYGVYSSALPSLYFKTGEKIEVYSGDRCIFRGKIETSTIQADKESLSIVAYDYIRNLKKSKIFGVKDFSNISAFDAVCKLFDEFEIPYSVDGILGGPDGEGSQITIDHMIKNKSAYDACMMIATEVHRNFGTFYYMFMDAAGNVNLMACDKYWSQQTVKPCSSSNIANPDGNIISFSYKEDASDIVTRVELYDSKGNPIDIETGESAEGEGDE